jgi:hypothetical protein
MANSISYHLAEFMKTNNQNSGAGNVNGAPLVWLRSEALFMLILSILLYAHSGASWWRFGLLFLTPDLAMAGYWLDGRIGAIAYNVVHSYVGPLALAVAALVGVQLVDLNHTWLAYAFIWTAHIAFDRALGYGLKYPDGFKSTHLGSLGKRVEA